MKKHPEFKLYQKSPSSLIPPTLVNGILYGLAWFVLVNYGVTSPILISTTVVLANYMAQLCLFAKFDRESFRICLPLSIIAIGLGLLQEVIFIQSKILVYPNEGNFPPVWILALYPLFSLTLNSSLAFLNKSLILSFFLGGFGALFSYLSGEILGRVQLFPPLAYPIIFLSWGVFLTVMIVLNRLLRGLF